MPFKFSESSNPFDLDTEEGLTAIAQSAGIKIKPQEPKVSFLQKIFDTLSVGEYAVGGLLAKKGISAGIREKITPSKALGIKNKIGAFVVDVLADPLTYTGVGAVGKGAKIGGKLLSEAGESMFRKIAAKEGEAAARKAVGNAVFQGEKSLLQPVTVNFMGKAIPGSESATRLMGKAMTGVDNVLEKTPIIGKTVQTFRNEVGRAFLPFYEIKKALPLHMAEDFENSLNKMFKGGRFESQQAIDNIVKLGAEAKRIDPEAGIKLTDFLEGSAVLTGKGMSQMNQTAKVIADDLAQMATTEKAAGILEGELENYVKHALTPEGRQLVEAAGGVSNFLGKPIRIKHKEFSARKLEGTIKEINAALSGKLEAVTGKKGANFFEPDIFKTWGARKVSHIKAMQTHQFFEDMKSQFGLQGGGPMRDVDGVRFVEGMAPELKGWQFPEPVMKYVDEYRKFLSDDESLGAFLKLADAGLTTWKSTVTSLFPSFHVRNFMGGAFNNWIAGLKNPALYADAAEMIAKKGGTGKFQTKLYGEMDRKELYNTFLKIGGQNQSGALDVMRTVQQRMDDALTTNPLKQGTNFIKNAPAEVSEKVELANRLPLFLDRLQKGDTYEEAMKQVMQYHFDYTPEGLTAFERNVMKRVMPFYRWARGNVPLQISQIVKQPGKYAGVNKLIRDMAGDEGNHSELLPEYIQEQLHIKTGGDFGTERYLYGLGLPVEDLNNWVAVDDYIRTGEKWMGSLNPFVRFPIELFSGHNFYYGKDLKENKWVMPYLTKVPGLSHWLEIRPVEGKDGEMSYMANPQKLALINSFAGRFYTTFGTLTDDRKEAWEKVLRTGVGSKSYLLDIEARKAITERDRENEIVEQLEDAGVLKTMRIPYVPGGSKKKTKKKSDGFKFE